MFGSRMFECQTSMRHWTIVQDRRVQYLWSVAIQMYGIFIHLLYPRILGCDILLPTTVCAVCPLLGHTIQTAIQNCHIARHTLAIRLCVARRILVIRCMYVLYDTISFHITILLQYQSSYVYLSLYLISKAACYNHYCKYNLNISRKSVLSGKYSINGTFWMPIDIANCDSKEYYFEKMSKI